MTLYFINKALCEQYSWLFSDNKQYQNYMFKFRVQMTDLFQVELNTKHHLFMRNVYHHLFQLGRIRRGSLEENKMVHKYFKALFNSANKPLDIFTSQILTTMVIFDKKMSDFFNTSATSGFNPTSLSTSASTHCSWNIVCEIPIDLVSQISAFHSPTAIANNFLSLIDNGSYTWHYSKRAAFDSSFPHYDAPLYTSLFAVYIVWRTV